ncbi:MAG: hypothetical protein MGU50_07690 [Trichodesmium sp. MAG_R02]|nr:hypothetical protein [Trichodesmium sp. MAG_R02]
MDDWSKLKHSLSNPEKSYRIKMQSVDKNIILIASPWDLGVKKMKKINFTISSLWLQLLLTEN